MSYVTNLMYEARLFSGIVLGTYQYKVRMEATSGETTVLTDTAVCTRVRAALGRIYTPYRLVNTPTYVVVEGAIYVRSWYDSRITRLFPLCLGDELQVSPYRNVSDDLAREEGENMYDSEEEEYDSGEDTYNTAEVSEPEEEYACDE